MELYLNSCVLDEIKEIYDWGILDGVTMNPSMMAKTGADFVGTLESICRAVPVKVFCQAVAAEADAIVEEAKIISSMGDNVVVKIHTSVEGIKAIRKIKETTEIKVCATAVHTAMEAIVVARAGADHAAVFLGFLGEADERSTGELMQSIVEAYGAGNIATRIMAASRSLQQIVDGFRLGADEMTCPYTLWKLFVSNPGARERWTAFSNDWHRVFGDRTWISG